MRPPSPGTLPVKSRTNRKNLGSRNVIVNDVHLDCSTLASKVAGLPQLKLGWIVAGGPAEARNAALQRLELIADTYLSVGTPVQWAATSLLGLRHTIQEQIRNRTRGNLEFLLSKVAPSSPWRESPG